MSVRTSGLGLQRTVPGWVRGYERGYLRDDLVAGLTLAVMLIPQSMAYASLAGMPPITGLYAGAVSLLVYAALGTSSHLSFGPFALVSLLTATALEPVAGGEPARYVAFAGVLAIMVGVLHLLLWLVRGSPIVDLISHPVVVGFTAAVGIVIALSQVRDLTGADIGRSERFLEAVVAAADAVSAANLPTVLVGLVAVAMLVLGKRVAPRVPAALVVVVVGIVSTLLLRLEDGGVALVGTIPSGLPRPAVPVASLDDVRRMLPSALVLAVICYAGNMSMAKSIATRTRERLDPDRELVASGVANVASGLVSGFPVAASFTRTVVVYNAGARTQLAGVVAAAMVVLTLVLLTPVLQPLPRAVLAAIVVAAVGGLVDVRSARAIVRVDRADAAIMAITFLATLLIGAERGLLVGVASNLLLHVARRMRPALVVLGRVEGTRTYRGVHRYPTFTDPGGIILRLDGALDFLSVQRVTAKIRDRVAAEHSIRWVVLEASGINGIDATGVQALYDLQHHLRAAGVSLHLATLRGRERDVVQRAGLWAELVDGTCHADIPSALRAAGVGEDARVLHPHPDEVRPSAVL